MSETYQNSEDREHTHEEQPLVSIVMSVFNGANYLIESLESIFAQTYPHIEILCFDDGSSDETLAILNTYEDNRLHVFSDGENKGLAARLNEGLKRSKGKYIARMDADDIALPNRIEKQVDFMEKHADVAACGTGFQRMLDGKKIYMPTSHNAIVAKQIYTPGMAHPTVMMRASFMQQKNMFYPNVPCAQDYALWVLMSRYGNLANVPEILLQYRVHKKSITHTKVKEKRVVLGKIHKEILKEISNMPVSQKHLDIHFSIATGVQEKRQHSIKSVLGYLAHFLFSSNALFVKQEILRKTCTFLVKR